MSTEYRRGIPSAAHVEAATRLGLCWARESETHDDPTWRFEVHNGVVEGDSYPETAYHRHRLSPVLNALNFRPIRTDGTPVDWEVLDAEVARAAQPAQPKPRNFADVRPDRHTWRWWRVVNAPNRAHLEQSRFETRNERFRWLNSSYEDWTAVLIQYWTDRTVIPTDEQGNPVSWESIAQPATTTNAQPQTGRQCEECDGVGRIYGATHDGSRACGECSGRGYMLLTAPATVTSTASTAPTAQPQGFRADLWRRICEACLGGIERANSAVSLIDVETIDTYLRWRANSAGTQHYGGGWIFNGRVPADILTRWAVYQELKPLYDIVDGAQGEAAMPRDVEAEWFTAAMMPISASGNWSLRRDARSVYAQNRDHITWRPEELGYGVPFRNFAAVLDAVAEQRVPMRGVSSFQTLDATNRTITEIVLGSIIETPTQPSPLPRFTADELDDVDHSGSTMEDSATLKRGKLPTVEAIGKYREVMAKRNGTVAEAVKASGIDCEVAQYVLERWAGGLSDGETMTLISACGDTVTRQRMDRVRAILGEKQISAGLRASSAILSRARIDALAQAALTHPTLDTSDPADTEAQRQRAEAKERQARMAAVQAQLAKERAARIAEPREEPTRFSLLEVDEAADPARSIEAWKAQRARNVVRPATVPAPQSAPKRKPFDVIDAQADGLSGSAALAVLLGRAMNAKC